MQKTEWNSLPAGAPDLLRPVVYSGPRFYALVGALTAIVAWGGVAYAMQLRHGLVVTGLRSYFFWGLYITNFVFFIGVSHAGTLISAILRVTGAEWRRPITRMAEVITAIALLIGAPMIIIDMGRPERVLTLLIHGRLQSPILWDVIAVMTYLVGSLIYLYIPMIPDLGRCHPFLRAGHPIKARIYKTLALNWVDTAEQHHLLESATRVMAVVIMPVAISVHTVVSYIFSMTMREGWHSTLFGPYFVVGAIYSGIAALILFMWLFRRVYRLERYIKEVHFRKLGYLLLTAGLVYAYTTFSEYLTLTYTGKGPEQELTHTLFSGQFAGLFWTGMAFTFMPVLIAALARWTGVTGLVLGSACATIGMWIKRFIIVTPTQANPVLPIQNVSDSYAAYQATWVEWSVTAAAFAAFVLLFVLFTKLFPIVSIWETAQTSAPAIPHRRRPPASILAGVLTAGLLIAWNTQPVASAQAPSPQPSVLTLTVSPGQPGALVVRAQLTDSAGSSVRGAPVRFLRKTSFGILELGTAATDEQGLAELNTAASPGREVAVEAGFAGSPDLLPAEATASTAVPGRPPAPLPGSLTTPHPNPWLVALAAGGVWAVYGWVVYTLFRISKAGSPAPVSTAGGQPALAVHGTGE